MSQQEFAPQSQGGDKQSLHTDTNSYAQPRFKAPRRRSGAMPKSDHPSTYGDPPPAYSYHAQTNASSAQQPTSRVTGSRREQASRMRNYSPDGDAFETGYRPWRSSVPSWTRSGNRKRGVQSMLIVFGILCAIALLLPLLLQLFLIMLGILAMIVLFPLLMIMALVVAFVVLRILGVPIARRRFRRGYWRW
ncbi:MAG TPA: hypothetical protein VKX46_16745 [Ktedonobacteraceae bacterium]|nr:hypothetical protein [Ktedonobacteraceae bacterium]